MCGMAASQESRLTSGEELRATTVVSNADPRRTLLGMVDPVELEPGFLARMRSYRSVGNVAKINLALSELPRFTALPSSGDARALAGCIHIGPDLEYLERAFDASKYGTFSPRPYLDVTIPSISDPDAGTGGRARDVDQRAVCAISPPRDRLDGCGPAAGRCRHRYALPIRAQSQEPDSSPAGHYTGRSRVDVRAYRRAYLPWRAGAGSAVHDAPASRVGAISHADCGAVPVRRWHSSRDMVCQDYPG